MKARLTIQDSQALDTRYMLEEIAAAASGAESGVGIFAFATVGGIDLLFSVDAVRSLASAGQLELIVGIDAITNREALQRLQELSLQFRGLAPRVFWNRGDGIFHPKLCCFRGGATERWLIGSGNLTPRGLRDSYEASVTLEGSSRQLADLRRSLNRFLAFHATEISPIDDSALARAAENHPSDPVSRVEPIQVLTSVVRTRENRRPAPERAAPPTRASNILIAELPRGGTRWQQANFDTSTTRIFFGIDPSRIDEQRDLFLTEILADGLSERDEVRRFTYTRSHNLRIQLAAKRGFEYPRRGRPIAVFRELKPRHYAYHLLFPDEDGHQQCSELLENNLTATVRRIIVSLPDFRKKWPRSLLARI